MIGRIFIKEKGSVDFVAKEFAYIKGLAEKDTFELAERTKLEIQATIQSKAKHPTGKLASGFQVGKIPNGYGVGDINDLNANHSYWRHQNYGSEAIGANWKHWLPKGKFVNDRWVVSDDGYYFMPSRPIPAMNYIEDTIAKIQSIIGTVLRKNK